MRDPSFLNTPRSEETDMSETVHIIGHYTQTLCGRPITTDMVLTRLYAPRPPGPNYCAKCEREAAATR